MILDWRAHQMGPPRACIDCRKTTPLRNEKGLPEHKVCAEAKREVRDEDGAML